MVESRNKVVSVTLDRPKALNSLNPDMCAGMKSVMEGWKTTGQYPSAMVVKGAGKAFCAGGDVKAVWEELAAGEIPSDKVGTGAPGFVHSDFFRKEYEMNYMLGVSEVPQVSLWDGFVMGGGVGISVLGKYRVATEKTMFAMPETAIGLFPDVGSSYWLPHLDNGVGYVSCSKCFLPSFLPSFLFLFVISLSLSRSITACLHSLTPHHTSLTTIPLSINHQSTQYSHHLLLQYRYYLGLTGARLFAKDLVDIGIATHFVASEQLEALEAELADKGEVEHTLDRFHVESIPRRDEKFESKSVRILFYVLPSFLPSFSCF
jgi:enoyl-CoA hydratase/carnithine racemase